MRTWMPGDMVDDLIVAVPPALAEAMRQHQEAAWDRWAIGVARPMAAPTSERQQDGAVAVIPIRGILTYRGRGGFGWGDVTATEAIEEEIVAAANDPRVKQLVLDVHSPGGSVEGIPELASTIRDVRGKIPVTAIANSVATSAAYWLAAQAGEVVATPSATVGSIGVYAVHVDRSEQLAKEGLRVTLISAGPRKVDGHPFAPLPDDVRARLQARVAKTYQQFLGDVARGRGRGLTPEQVEAQYGGGDVVGADEALAMGLVDRIATRRQVLAALSARPSTSDAGPRADRDWRARRLRVAMARARQWA